MNNFKIGLEIHIKLKTNHKLLSSSSAVNTSISNSNLSMYDIGTPGTFPVFNHECVEPSLKACILFKCAIASYLEFDRKHYMYPDLPLGFQITQDRNPIGTNGIYYIRKDKYIRIDNVHIEADAAKIKEYDNKICIDFNRCCVPLIEVVTKPDLSNEEEVIELIYLLINDLRINNISNAQLELGELRVDVNISHKDSSNNNRIEIKNLNSSKSIKNAIRSAKTYILDNNNSIENSITAHYSETTKSIFESRHKESKFDYWYIPEHSMIPIKVNENTIKKISITNTINIVNNICKIIENKIEYKSIMSFACNQKIFNIFNICNIIKLSKNTVCLFIQCIMQISLYIEESQCNSKDIGENIVEYCKLILNKNITKIDGISSLKQYLSTGQNINSILKEKNLYISDEINIETKNQIIKYIKENTSLYQQIIQKDEKAINFSIGYVRKKFLGLSPQKIKLILLGIHNDL